MTFPRPRAAILACLLAPILAAPSLADDASPTQPVPAATGAAVATAAVTMPMPTPPSFDGGTAVINFVAPVTAKTMAELAQSAQTAAIGGADAIRINISSRGGSLHAIQFAVNVLKNLPIPVETVAMSQIASAAVALYCAGQERYMAEGSALYLHQQRGFEEIQLKTAGAVVRELELSTEWYDDVLRGCAEEGIDPATLDYSVRDLVIDTEQAAKIGMATASMDALDHESVWGTPLTVIAPEDSISMYPYPVRR